MRENEVIMIIQEKIYCSFCGKSNKELNCMIQGSAVFICDNCVRLCYDILVETGYLPDTSDRGLQMWIDAVEEFNK